MKIAVTGATGQLGQLVVNELLEQNTSHDIIAVVRDEAKAVHLAQRGAEIRVAAYGNPEALKAAFTGVDKLLLISSSEIGQRIEQHQNVINAAQEAGVQHIVYTSAPRAATTNLILAPDHKATEENIAQSGLAYTILRNNWYTENYKDRVETARQTGAVVAAAGAGRVASATRADFAAGAVAVLLGTGHEDKVYELGGDYAWNYNELAETIGEMIGKPVVYKAVDAETLVDILKGAGLNEGTAGFVAALDSNIADGALAEVTGDLSKLIGRPTTPLKQGLEEAIA
ncbi:MAG: SDR family oxidoreductase [Ardenticatenaceae bacterium]|nr:SDR family oxidoreductase [Ardenticatenaceae bacterium]